MSVKVGSTTMNRSQSISTTEVSPWRHQYWMKNPSFDLAFVSGGALFTLMVAAVAFQVPNYLPLFFWVWLIGFEGSHFWATYSRTYIDKKYIKENKKLLISSLIFFAFPAIAVALDSGQNTLSYTTMYGFFIFVWSLYHNARQHYGFLSIYTGKANISSDLKQKMVKALYFSIVSAQIYFLLNFKLPLTFSLPQAQQVNLNLGFLTSQLPIMISLASLVYLTYLSYESLKLVGSKAFSSLYYIAICWLFYSTMFYLIAPQDLLMQNLSGGESLMLIAIMNSLFHNIQYHAIVWYYGSKRYDQKQKVDFGVARFITGKTMNYIGFALLMGAVYGFITWHVGDWPSFSGSWQNVKFHSWAYILFFGIIGHHFFLDQVIWHPSRSKELKNYLKL